MKRKYQRKLSDEEKARRTAERWKLWLDKRGPIVRQMLVEWQTDPLTTLANIADIAGISRERVRQLLVRMYGTTAKPKSMRRCGIQPFKEVPKEVQEVLDILREQGINFSRLHIPGCWFKADNGKVFKVNKACKSYLGYNFTVNNRGIHRVIYPCIIVAYADPQHVFIFEHPGVDVLQISINKIQQRESLGAFHLLK